jgi:hypothetical protein
MTTVIQYDPSIEMEDVFDPQTPADSAAAFLAYWSGMGDPDGEMPGTVLTLNEAQGAYYLTFHAPNGTHTTDVFTSDGP